MTTTNMKKTEIVHVIFQEEEESTKTTMDEALEEGFNSPYPDIVEVSTEFLAATKQAAVNIALSTSCTDIVDVEDEESKADFRASVASETTTTGENLSSSTNDAAGEEVQSCPPKRSTQSNPSSKPGAYHSVPGVGEQRRSNFNVDQLQVQHLNQEKMAIVSSVDNSYQSSLEISQEVSRSYSSGLTEAGDVEVGGNTEIANSLAGMGSTCDGGLHLVEASLVVTAPSPDDQESAGNPSEDMQLAEIIPPTTSPAHWIPDSAGGKLFCFGLLALPALIILAGIVCGGGGYCYAAASDGNNDDTIKVTGYGKSYENETDNRGSMELSYLLPSTIAPTRSQKGPEEEELKTTSNYCGTSWVEAAISCGTSCPGGVDNECPEGQRCFGDITFCGGFTLNGTNRENYCGSNWTDAASTCGSSCPRGMDFECPEGQRCYAGVTSC